MPSMVPWTRSAKRLPLIAPPRTIRSVRSSKGTHNSTTGTARIRGTPLIEPSVLTAHGV